MKGATAMFTDNHGAGTQFQSTHPRRMRHFEFHQCRLNRENFNPRTREGCDKEDYMNLI